MDDLKPGQKVLFWIQTSNDLVKRYVICGHYFQILGEYTRICQFTAKFNKIWEFTAVHARYDHWSIQRKIWNMSWEHLKLEKRNYVSI